MKVEFLGLPEQKERARVALIPAPFEGTVSFKSGTKEAPLRILTVSPQLEFFDEETLTEPQEELGFFTYPLEEFPVEVEKALRKVEFFVEDAVSAGMLPITIGGEHTVTLGAVRALLRRYPSLRLVYFDAHPDLRDSYQESPFSHACVMRRLYEQGVGLLGIGIRTTSKEEFEFAKKNHITLVSPRELKKNPERILKVMEEFLQDFPVYVSVDLDGLDPSEAPGVGTPEPGGLSWYELLSILKTISSKRVVGFDVVEARPLPEDVRTEYLAARLVYKFSAYLCKYGKL